MTSAALAAVAAYFALLTILAAPLGAWIARVLSGDRAAGAGSWAASSARSTGSQGSIPPSR